MPRSSGEKSPAKLLSRSAPTSPKNVRDLSKSSTLPPPRLVATGGEVKSSSSNVVVGSVTDVTASPRKSRSATFSNFLKKLSPKLRQGASSKNRDKTWYVVDIAQQDVDGSGGDHVVRKISEPGVDLIGAATSNGTSSEKGVVVMTTTTTTTTSNKKSSPSHKGTSTKKLSKNISTKPPLPPAATSGGGEQSGDVASKDIESDAQVQQVSAAATTVGGVQPVIKINSVLTSNVENTQATAVPRVRRTHQPPRTLNLLNKIVVHPPEAERVKGKMASIESIGSCSLDIDATASESSATAADGQASSVSQRTLRSTSIDLENGSSIVVESISKEPSPIKMSSKRTSGSEVRYISELYIPNGGGGRHRGTHESEQEQRKPSYISLSCSVSGYTSYSCYNSKVREELRSRDSSPARLAFSSAIISNGGGGSKSHLLDLDGSNEECAPVMHTSSVIVNVNGHGTDEVDRADSHVKSTSSSPSWKGLSRNGELANKCTNIEVWKESASDEVVAATERTSDSNVATNAEAQGVSGSAGVERKSLIQQRIERLYGPGALAQGFRLHRERHYKKTITTSTTVRTVDKVNPPVFKHLHQNFCKQLDTSLEPSTVEAKVLSPSQFQVQTVSVTKGEAAMFNVERQNGEVSGLINGHADQTTTTDEVVMNGDHLDKPTDITADIKDGHWFIQTMNSEQAKIKALIANAEEHLQSSSLSEDACGRLRAAIGKANLLLSQKFQQFRGLCEKNLIQDEDEPFPTTVSDLAGFWDMVLIQVDDIHKMFSTIEKMKERGWTTDDMNGSLEIIPTTNSTATTKGLKKAGQKKPSAPGGGTAANAQQSAKANEAAKAREEARKRLLEAKRKGRQQAATAAVSGIEIFVPDEKE